MNNKTLLLTGCNGFIGTHLSALIKQRFPACRIVGVSRWARVSHAEIDDTPASDVHAIDLLDKDRVMRLLDDIRPDFIVHLAGIIYSWEWDAHYRGNVETTINLLEAVRQLALPCRVLVPGSAAEYGWVPPEALPVDESRLPNPLTPYGVSKSWQTTLARRYALLGVDVLVGRIFNVAGAGVPEGLTLGAFASRLTSIRLGAFPPRMEVGALHYRRDYLDIVDVCEALMALVLQGQKGEIYNICSGSSIALKDILDAMVSRCGMVIDVVSVPTSTGGYPEILDIFGSNRKVVEHTGWQPGVALETSIAQLMAARMTRVQKGANT